jgi:GrpB-like predicted nucleotidyltransferase (UPF0157 family)
MDDSPSAPRRTVRCRPYDPAWPQLYAQLEASLKQALGPNLVEIHHVGSTAVPGLSGKARIDTLAVVRDRYAAIPLIQSIGFQHLGEQFVPGREGFRLRVPFQSNLHLFEQGHPEVDTMLFFRDLLRNEPEVRKRYEEAKAAILENQADVERINPWFSEYTDKKGECVKRLLRENGFQTLRVVRPTNPLEWQEASTLLGLADLQAHSQSPQLAPVDCLLLLEGVDIVGAAVVPTDRTLLPRIIVSPSNACKLQLELRFRELVRQLFGAVP